MDEPHTWEELLRRSKSVIDKFGEQYGAPPHESMIDKLFVLSVYMLRKHVAAEELSDAIHDFVEDAVLKAQCGSQEPT